MPTRIDTNQSSVTPLGVARIGDYNAAGGPDTRFEGHSTLREDVESAFVSCRRDYLGLRGAIQKRNPMAVDDAYDQYGVTLRNYLRLVSVRLYLPIQQNMSRSLNTDSGQEPYLRLARGNMRQVTAFFRLYRESESRQLPHFERDLESLDRLLLEQYRRERADLLPNGERQEREPAMVA